MPLYPPVPAPMQGALKAQGRGRHYPPFCIKLNVSLLFILFFRKRCYKRPFSAVANTDKRKPELMPGASKRLTKRGACSLMSRQVHVKNSEITCFFKEVGASAPGFDAPVSPTLVTKAPSLLKSFQRLAMKWFKCLFAGGNRICCEI